MYAIVKSEPKRMSRRGGALEGVVLTVLAVIGLMVVLSAIF